MKVKKRSFENKKRSNKSEKLDIMDAKIFELKKLLSL